MAFTGWNYPVYVLDHRAGFASIDGQSADGTPWHAIGLFTSREKAEAYRQASDASATIRELVGLAQTRSLLSRLSDAVTAVAVDPTISEGRHSATHCFSIRTVLEKYLVQPDRR